MSFDYHGAWEAVTGHVSPLSYRQGDRFSLYNVEATTALLIENGMAPGKLVLGVPFYGQSFTLESPDYHGINCSATGAGLPGEFTQQPGMLSYYEICYRVQKRQWAVERDGTDTYAYAGDQWVSFDDPAAVQVKADFVTKFGLGGIMAWTVDLDDFSNRCCSETYPLLKSINRAFGRLKAPLIPSCSRPPPPVTPPPAITTVTPDEGLGSSTTEHHHHPSPPDPWWTTTEVATTTTTKPVTWWTQPTTQKPTTTTQQIWWKPESTTTTTTQKPSTTTEFVWWRPDPTTSTTTTSPPSTTTTTTTIMTTTQKSTTTEPVWWKPDSTTGSTSTTEFSWWPPRPPSPTVTNKPTTSQPTTVQQPTYRPTTTQQPTYRPTTTQQPTYKPTSPKPTPPSEPVTACTPGQFYADPIDCNSYYHCVRGGLKKLRCPSSLHWNDAQKTCDWPANANCQAGLVESIPAPAPVVPERPVELAPPAPPAPPQYTEAPPQRPTEPPYSPPAPPSSGCTSDGYYSHPEDCNSFYICASGKLMHHRCPSGLAWNSEKKVCDWSYNVKCLQRTPYVAKPYSLNPSANPTYFINYLGRYGACTENFAPHPTDCNKYLVCLWGQYQEQSCPAGLHWNYRTKNCDWPYLNVCATGGNEIISSTYYPTTSYPTTPSTTQWTWTEGTTSKPPSTTKPPWEWKPETTTEGWKPPSTTKPPWEWKPETTTEGWKPPPTAVTTTKPSTTTEWQWKPEQTTSWVWRPATPAWTEAPDLAPALSGYFKVVCYFTNWAWYRQGYGKYLPEDINYKLCTHIVYGFAVLDGENYIIKPHDSWADEENQFYERVTKAKKHGTKVTIAIGGWNDSAGDKYSRLVNNPSARRRFISHVVDFILKHNFDGLDLDWEYPKCWQVDCNKGPSSDKENFAAFVRELRQAFAPKGLLLSAAVSPSKKVIDEGYDVRALAENLDWLAVMSYDYHGQWDKKTGHNSPFYYHPEDDYADFNTDYSINYWIKQGMPRRKIVMGMPFYGQSFTLADPNKHGLNAPATGPGEAGEQTRAAGFLAYYEICQHLKSGQWNEVIDPERRIGPYIYKGNQWIGFDDATQIKRKSQYIREMNLGGAMIWALDLDDFKNRCGEGRHPLLTTIAKVLAPPPGSGGDVDYVTPSYESTTTTRPTTLKPITTTTTKKPKPTYKPPDYEIPTRPDYENPYRPTTTKPTTTRPPYEITTSLKPTTTTSYYPPALKSEFKVICYFTNWAWYRQGPGKYLPSDIDSDLCTHIIYGFAVLDSDQLVIKPHDTWADYDNKFYEKVTALKKAGVKVLLAIGGWNDSAGDKYSRLVNNAGARTRFVEHVFNFLKTNNFDGLDLDWEYPKCWQVNCQQGPPSDKEGFSALIQELSAKFKPEGFLLSAAVSPSKTVIDNGYDVPVMSEKLDWISVMTYDYHGQWDKQTGHVAPMYAHPEDEDVTFNANWTLHYWVKKGAAREKLVFGMPMYGQSFSLADRTQNGLNSPTYGGGEAGEETRARGFLSYYEICQRIKNGWKVIRDEYGAMGPYAIYGDQWVSFDDQAMIRHKSEFVYHNKLGGAMIWALDLDDFRNLCGCEKYPLLRTINRVLRNYPGPGPNCKLDAAAASLRMNPNFFSNLYNPVVPTTALSQIQCASAVKHFSDCSKYYECKFGRLWEATCPKGYYFNERSLICDKAERTTCSTNVSADYATDDQRKVICYFTNWAWYRKGTGKYLPQDIDPELCSHIIYGFASLDPNTLTIRAQNKWADINNEFYSKVTAQKEKNVKVLLALGGWNDSKDDKYSRLVSSPAAREQFIHHALRYLVKYNFDGLSLDWAYPTCPQSDCSKGRAVDKEGFSAFIQELSTVFKPYGLLLSAAVSPSKVVIDKAYDVPALSEYLDFVSLMAFDYHGPWDGRTGHIAPLYHLKSDTYDHLNIDFGVKYWLSHGMQKEKLILGMPLYGESFTLVNGTDYTYGAKVVGPGKPGEFTQVGGFLAYYEICNLANNGGWNVEKNFQGIPGSMMHLEDQWVSFDDVSDIRRKSTYIKENQLGGGMVWALDLDDFSGLCGCGPNPLLTTVNQELRNYKKRATREDCT
ncbi:unnamed protein product [Bemisia tabaci]|uniref:Chitinase 3 n=2 Tax=Bemisia tabaci TaxID=7038 RepID=A0A9P0AGH1_BEMTA|nr:unnamed protein product [Bemisia tabaci]